MLKSNNFGILAGTVYNINEHGKLVSFTLGVREYDSRTKETTMVFYPIIAIYDNLKKLLLKLDKGTNMVVAYSLYINNNTDSKYPQVGIKAEDITLMSPKRSNNYDNTKSKKETVVKEEDDLGEDINIEDLDEELQEYFSK